MINISSTFVKPPFLKQSDEIFNFLESRIFPVNKIGPVHLYLPREVFEEHYSHIRKYGFFDSMIDTFTQEGIIFCAYFGEEIVQDIRKVLGPTDPSQADPGTVRGRFSKDSLELSKSQNRVVDNVMHASGNDVEGEIEFDRFLPYLL